MLRGRSLSTSDMVYCRRYSQCNQYRLAVSGAEHTARALRALHGWVLSITLTHTHLTQICLLPFGGRGLRASPPASAPPVRTHSVWYSRVTHMNAVVLCSSPHINPQLPQPGSPSHMHDVTRPHLLPILHTCTVTALPMSAKRARSLALASESLSRRPRCACTPGPTTGQAASVWPSGRPWRLGG